MGVTGYMGVDHLGSWDSQKEQEWGGGGEDRRANCPEEVKTVPPLG